MNGIGHKLRYCFFLVFFSFVCWLLFYNVDAWASVESVGNFRSRYDVTMKWVNFFIMVVIFIKYGYKPTMHFIYSQKGSIENRINDLEKKRNAMVVELDNAIKVNERKEAGLIRLRRNIMTEGEKKYQDIIDQARQQSRMMLDNTRRKIDVQIIEARNEIKNEIVDAAIELTEKKLKALIGNDYNSNILNVYTKSIE